MVKYRDTNGLLYRSERELQDGEAVDVRCLGLKDADDYTIHPGQGDIKTVFAEDGRIELVHRGYYEVLRRVE